MIASVKHSNSKNTAIAAYAVQYEIAALGNKKNDKIFLSRFYGWTAAAASEHHLMLDGSFMTTEAH